MLRDKKHLQFIRSLPCLRCNKMQCQAAHIRYTSGGGTGIKPDDDCTVPLCYECHALQHRIGEVSFYNNLTEKALECAKYLYNQKDSALQIIREYQKCLFII